MTWRPHDMEIKLVGSGYELAFLDGNRVMAIELSPNLAHLWGRTILKRVITDFPPAEAPWGDGREV